MKILVTGVNGLVGKAVATKLSEEHDIFGLSRSAENKTNLDITYYPLDIAKIDSFNILNHLQIDAIIHCAASLDFGPMSEQLIQSNCVGLRNIIALALQKQCSQFIYFSSIPIIGIPKQIPITEDHSINPMSTYHITKYFGEMYIRQELKNIATTIFRIPSPIGIELNEQRIIPMFIKKCIANEDIILAGKGGRVQNYIDVKDIAYATDLAIKQKVSGIFNIAAEKSFSNKELAEACIRSLQSQSKIIYQGNDPEEENKWIISVEKAKRELNFQSSISLETSILEISKRYLS